MAVRQIPLKQRPYLMDDPTESSSTGVPQSSSGEGSNKSKESRDPAVQKSLMLIRKKVLSDRALHDQVRLVVNIPIYSARCEFGLKVADMFSYLLLIVGC